MLKQLLEEAKTIEASVELDSVFESVNLSPDVKDNFKLVFEQAVKTNAAKLAEQHINKIVEDAEVKVGELVEEQAKAIETKLYEDAEKYFSHITSEWMNENKQAVDNEIKANLFESLLGGMKELFVEHNVTVPTESVDVVAELEQELEESQTELKSLFDAKTSVDQELKAIKREAAISEATVDMADSQKEKVRSLVEGLDFSESFDNKLKAIVSMMTEETVVLEPEKEEQPLDEGTVNTVEDQLNFSAEKPAEQPVNPLMASYMNAASMIK